LTKYLENEKIIKIGEIRDSLYIIKEGTVSIRNEIKEVRKLHQYDYF
jgi:signal-transduction protein with cAMP-binding, CBS, and nucleotidyltransferase domain